MNKRVKIFILVFVFVPLFTHVSLTLLDYFQVATNETLENVVAGFFLILFIVWILVLLPIAILWTVEWFAKSESGPLWQRILKNVLRLPIGLFGLTAMVIGVAVVGWLLYNVFVETQPEFPRGLRSKFGALCGGLPFYCLVIMFGVRLIHVSVKRGSKKTGENGSSKIPDPSGNVLHSQ